MTTPHSPIANPPTAETLAALRQYDTPTVCNAIELWDLRPRSQGYFDGSIRACFAELPPMVGYALTNTFRSAGPPRGGDAYGSMAAQVAAYEQLPGPPVMVFQDLDQPVASATFGEVMCTTYQAFGAQGLITSGAGRDLAQVQALKFPCFTGSTISAHGFCHFLSMNIPVTVGGVVIYPGDLLHGDLNGVTTIPLEIASEVPGVCQAIMQAEAIVLDYLKQSGPKSVKQFEAARAECHAMIQSVSKRLKSTRAS